MKTCGKCRIEKEFSEFNRRSDLQLMEHKANSLKGNRHEQI